MLTIDPPAPPVATVRTRPGNSRLLSLAPTFSLSSGQLVLACSAWWTVAFNGPFFASIASGRRLDDPAAWGFVLAVGGALLALNVLLLGLVAHRRAVKPLAALLNVAAAAGVWFIAAYGVTLDPSMLRNVMRTDLAEARELLSSRFLLHMLLYAGLPLLLLARVRVKATPWHRAWPRHLALLLGALCTLLLLLWSVFQPLSSLTRNQHGLRYLVTPANLLWSTGSVLAADARGAARPRQSIGLDARAGTSWAARQRPLVVVLVVGETARAANWGLNGYPRQTTPELASSGVVNFSDVTSCGTNTETSLPCMFAPVGRRDYDEARIRGQQSLLHVVARAGVAVDWRDNQSGCKGVCEFLPAHNVDVRATPALCDGDRCLDEALTQDLSQRLQQARGTQLWVLHTLGNHGPSYYRRYPAPFARFQPDCRDDDLRKCTPQQVVNAYDNALLYTDHLLAAVIRTLESRSAEVDSALLYVSDHGESLGEQGLFLHGLPYPLAPDVQKRVPMVWWHSAGFERAAGLADGCLAPALAARAHAPLTHDHLFHTLLGALDVRTSLHVPALDLTSACRPATGR